MWLEESNSSMLSLITTFPTKLTLTSTISKNIIPINPQCFYYCIQHVAGHKKRDDYCSILGPELLHQGPDKNNDNKSIWKKA